MIKREELSNPLSCMSRAKDNERIFVLLGRDVAAPMAIRHWCSLRVSYGKNTWDDPQIKEAMECAARMEVERAEPEPRPLAGTEKKGEM